MHNQKPYKKFLVVTTPVEGDCWRSKVKNKNGDTLFDTYDKAITEGLPATKELSTQAAMDWIDLLYKSI